MSIQKLCKLFIAPSGRPILVGKNALANDYLSLKWANQNDSWLHVTHYTGAHVIIQNHHHNYKDLQEYNDDINYAGTIAVQFSKAKGLQNVKVDVCKIKDLSKDKNDPPGLVYVNNKQTITV
jgi:predicted ribosome quality control (RQC) complex YloA/Tae2 family protein